MKKYLPVTYVDEDGVIWTKEQLKKKLYKRNEKQIIEQRAEFGSETRVYTIQRIERVRDAPKQGELFG